jgi:hypothetical protein
MLLRELARLVNDSREGISFGVDEVKECLTGEFRNPIFWSNRQVADHIMWEIREGLHFIHAISPDWRKDMLRGNIQMIFDDRDKENWSEKADVILETIEDGRMFVKWEDEKVDDSLLELDQMGFGGPRYLD